MPRLERFLLTPTFAGLVFAAAFIFFAASLAAQDVNLPVQDVAIEPRLTDVYRVGKMDGASWELYGPSVQVGFDRTGKLYVFDPQNFRVVVVGTDGRLVRTVGMKGEGPGELRMPVGFAVTRDGTIAIADVAQRSIVLYDTGGTYQRSVLFGSSSRSGVGTLQPDPRGGALISTGQTSLVSQVPGQSTYQIVRGAAAAAAGGGRLIVRYPLAVTESARVIHQAWQPPRPAPPAQTGRVGAPSAQRRVFEPQLLSAVLPDGGLVTSDSSAYALKLLDADGVVRRTVRRPIRPEPVTAAMERAERDRRFAELTSGDPNIRFGRGSSPSMPRDEIARTVRRTVDQLQFYPELPVVTGLAAGWTGKVWVSRAIKGGVGRGPVDVLSATGQYLGTIAASGVGLPNAFGPNGLVAFVERDQFDVVSVVVRRLSGELR